LASSGIALSTGTLIIFALIAGFFIIGLTMYSSALDRLKDYGTLKAIGASNKYITKLILMQALLFTVVGFAVGLGLLEGFRAGVANSGLIFSFSPLVLLSMFSTIGFISLSGASFALIRIRSVEPAAVFR
jgi:putative ABC transport system permease protein